MNLGIWGKWLIHSDLPKFGKWRCWLFLLRWFRREIVRTTLGPDANRSAGRTQDVRNGGFGHRVPDT